MQIVSISDVHIKEKNDEASQVFYKFLEHEKTKSSDTIILLGDIFDLMIGPYPEYIREFEHIFRKLDELASNKKIYYFQGNHDFHLLDIFSKQKKFKNLKNIEIKKSGVVISVGSKDAYFEHGDDAEIDNVSYKIYKKVINNKITSLLARSVLNYNFVDFVGSRMSKASREKNNKKYKGDFDTEELKSKFRISSENVAEKYRCEIVVMGHSHVKDYYMSSSGFVYLNNGYVPIENCFCSITEDGQEIILL